MGRHVTVHSVSDDEKQNHYALRLIYNNYDDQDAVILSLTAVNICRDQIELVDMQGNATRLAIPILYDVKNQNIS